VRAAVRDYPLARLPGLAGLRALRGRLNASFAIAGPTNQPCLSGGLTLAGVGWEEKPLGDGRVVFRCVPGGTSFEGPLLEALTVRGQLRRYTEHREAALQGTVSVVVDGRGLGGWFPGGTGSGAVRAVATVSGPLAAPRVTAEAKLDALTLSWPGSPVGSVRVDGPLQFEDRRIVVGPLRARVGAGGWIEIAGARGPGRLALPSRPTPLPATDVDLRVRGSGLSTTRPISGFAVRDLALDLRLAQAGERWRLTGGVDVGHDILDLSKQKKGASARLERDLRSGMLAHIWADVHVAGAANAIEVRLPYAPDATVGIDCWVQGPLSSPRLTGQIRGDGAYSSLLLGVADQLNPREIRGCDLGLR
jgi:hypothetical protein